ncbi:MAG: hypothetical protein DSY76_03700 [Bacteroidetes bacterium]|nr:MAG: hypothetical protein DSY76_03700 [Bacteroidota bacterium]
MSDTTFYQLYVSDTSSTDSSLFGNYSNLNTKKTAIPQQQTHFFTNHELKVKNTEYIVRNNQNNNYAFPILIIETIIILILFNTYKKQKLHLSLFFNKFYQKSMGKSLFHHPAAWLFFIISTLNISLLVDLLVKKNILGLFNDFPQKNEFLLPKIWLAVILFYFIKFSIIYFTGKIFNVEKLRREYSDYILLWFISMGLFLNAYLWLELYLNSQWIYPVLIGFWVVSVSLRILKPLSQIIAKSDFRSFHFFIYLCNVEILPLIVLGKIVLLAIS